MEKIVQHPARPAYLVVALFSAIGVGFGAWAYFGTETGVDGTEGALLALLGALAVMLCALLVVQAEPAGKGRVALDVLMGLGAILTSFAAWMLMQYIFAAAMALAFVALIVAATRPVRRIA